MNSDSVGILKYRGEAIDSVRLSFEPLSIGKEAIIYKVHSGPDAHKFILHTGLRRAVLDEEVPYFYSYFSVPLVAKDKMYYWGIDRAHNKVYAMKYDLATQEVDSVYVRYDQVQTDVPPYYHPVMKQGEVLFAYYDSVLVVGEGFEVLRRYSIHY